MKIGVLGTGPVGQAIATRLAELGHEVTMGARDAANEKAAAWAAEHGGAAGDFRQAAAGAELVVNATAGSHAAAAVGQADPGPGTVLLDVSNALDGNFPPGLTVPPGDSTAEQLQRAHPQARVVKALNTMNCEVMVHPELVPAPHEVFVAADDDAAKAAVTALLQQFGWPEGSVRDVGPLSSARGLEAGVLFWVTLRVALGHNHFNFHIADAQSGNAPSS
ncbi:MAG TPA: NAD(P)-binding domain-containing protein [Mycobacteriales bacterium]|jgi:predicted dinucleotide-binding enzyme|nr:NAD(P)-binding domain-containing protein [Mycobacteriales bacterium]